MRKAILAVLAAVLSLALWVSVANADRGIRTTPAETTLTMARFTLEGGIGTPIDCVFVSRLTFRASIPKALGQLMGNSTVTVSTNSCASGNMGFLVAGRRVTGPVGPGHFTYGGFLGTLPRIEGLLKELYDVEFWISQEGINCRTNGSVAIEAASTGGNPATGWAITSQNVPVTGDFFCIFSSLEINASGTLSDRIQLELV